MREPTLPLDYDVLGRSHGFRSPWLVRIRFWIMAIACRVQAFELVDHATQTRAKGWLRISDRLPYIVTVSPLRRQRAPKSERKND